MKTSIFFAGMLVVFLAPGLCNASAQSEPQYQGKSLNAWIADMHSPDDKIREGAHQAIREIGTNALPYLIAETRDLGRLQKENPTNFDTDPDLLKRHSQVRVAFRELGAIAEPMVQQLVTLLNDGTAPFMAAEMLVLIDTNAASSAYTQAMTNRLFLVRVAGAAFIGTAGVSTNETAVVSELIKCLKYDGPEPEAFRLRSLAAGALGALGRQPERTVPALIERLPLEKRLENRVQIVKALGRFGKQAQAAVPLLRPMTNDSDIIVQRVSTQALKQIEGKSP